MMFPPGIELAYSGSYSGRRGPVSRHAHAGAEGRHGLAGVYQD